jgi:preprotein translocase subunit SecE
MSSQESVVRTVAIIDNVKDAGGNVTGWWGNFRTFLTEVRNELKRVTWPSRKEVYATTLVVILTSIFFGVYLFALDGILFAGIQWIFKRFGVA